MQRREETCRAHEQAGEGAIHATLLARRLEQAQHFEASPV